MKRRVLVGWSVGSFATSVLVNAFGLLHLRFMTDSLGLSMAAAALHGLPALAQAAGAPVPAAHPPLGALRMVTIPAPDLALIEAAYARHLGYRTVWKGTVPAALERAAQNANHLPALSFCCRIV